MKKVMMMGRVSCGKTTLCQKFAGEALTYRKTQTVQLVGNAIDTPGEYVENRSLMRGLTVTAVDADAVLFLQACTDTEFNFSPGQAAMYGRPVIGVITKTDLTSDPRVVMQGKELLELAGASPVFAVSAVSGQGMGELRNYLEALP